MGVLRFLVPKRDRAAVDAASRAYVTGHDDVPWTSRAVWTEDILSITRQESDSGSLHVPWRVAGRGELMLSTPVLMERNRPYHLDVELARGCISRIRYHLWAWPGANLVPPEAPLKELAKAIKLLSKAVTTQHMPEKAADFAESALQTALGAIELLAISYASQAIAARQKAGRATASVLGVNLGGQPLKDAVGASLSPLLAGAFNAAIAPMAWREIEGREGRRDWALTDRQLEFCRSTGLKVCSGPLLEFSPAALPDWLYLWEGEEENITSFIVDFMRAVVGRYRGRVHIWQCAARLNVGDMLSFNEEQRLRLAALSVETVRAVDPKAPVVLRIDQPWGEFMSRDSCELSPLHFADALVRADLGLAGIALEINMGYHQPGSSRGDLLDLGRQIDRWSTLGLPLLATLVVPSSSTADPLARVPALPLEYSPTGVDPKTSAEWVARALPLLLSKPAMQGVFFNQLQDSAQHEYAHGGLLDANDAPKPIFDVIRAARSGM